MECSDLVFSGHAVSRMFERQISQTDVRTVAVATRLQDKEEVMNCAICKLGETHPGQVTVTLQRGETTVVLEGVPAEVCDSCGEYYLSEEVTGLALAKAKEAVRHGAEVEILRFAA